MSTKLKLSDYCVIDHWQHLEGETKPPLTPVWLSRLALILLDRKMHFTGLRGGMWRLLGVDRSFKNPNICNI